MRRWVGQVRVIFQLALAEAICVVVIIMLLLLFACWTSFYAQSCFVGYTDRRVRTASWRHSLTRVCFKRCSTRALEREEVGSPGSSISPGHPPEFVPAHAPISTHEQQVVNEWDRRRTSQHGFCGEKERGCNPLRLHRLVEPRLAPPQSLPLASKRMPDFVKTSRNLAMEAKPRFDSALCVRQTYWQTTG